MDYGLGYNKTYVDFIDKVEANVKPTEVIVDIEGNGDEHDKVFLFKQETPIGDTVITLRLSLGDDFKTFIYILKISLIQGSFTFEFQDGFDDDDPNKNVADLIKNLTADLDSAIDPIEKSSSFDNGISLRMVKQIRDAVNA